VGLVYFFSFCQLINIQDFEEGQKCDGKLAACSATITIKGLRA